MANMASAGAGSGAEPVAELGAQRLDLLGRSKRARRR